MPQTQNELKQSQEKTAAPEKGAIRRESEESIPVRTEQERLREAEADLIEQKILKAEHARPEKAAEAPVAAAKPSTPTVTTDPVTKEIEKILSDDLQDLYQGMSPEQRVIFKKEGERTAGTLRIILDNVKLKTSNILDLIRKWLRLIPGINKFFLEQEAKIKSDKVIELHRKIHEPPS